MSIMIVGGGIGGLTLALSLHARGIPCRVYEAVSEIKALGVGINLLPHATRELHALGLEAALSAAAVTTREICFYNRFGQLIHAEPRGRFAGYDYPQYSIHRGDLQMILLQAVRERLGADAVVTGHQLADLNQDADGVTAHFIDPASGAARPPVRASIVVGADGIRSKVRATLYPTGDDFRYSGITMWRGVTRWKPFLTGASAVFLGWFTHGKMVVYPIRNAIDAEGHQLVNWLCEIAVPPRHPGGDWSMPGRIEDFAWAIAEKRYPWLDIDGLCRAADLILEYPMVDKDPLPAWSHGRVTLLGDAAHPLYPRGSNGGGQAILDVRALTQRVVELGAGAAALTAYDADRREAANKVVLTNRSDPPDAIIREVHERTGDKPFDRIEDVISRAELEAMSERYKRIAGFDRATLAAAS